MNVKNYRGGNKSSKLCKISAVKFCFKLCPGTRWHMSPEDVIRPSKRSTELDREWPVDDAVLNYKPRIRLLF